MSKKNVHTEGRGERAGAVLFAQWDEFCRLRLSVLSQGDIDSIHDLRVASRRMRAMIGLFAPFVDGSVAGKFAKQLRRITRKLGRLRNVDEAMVYFSGLSEPQPVLAGLLRTIRVREMRAVADVLDRFPRQDLDRDMRKIVAELVVIPADDPALPVYFSETSIQRYQRVFDLLLSATVPGNVLERHALRIAIKKWRYLLETLGQVCRHDYSAALFLLKEYQTLLGSLNDMAEFGELCDTLDIPDNEKRIVAASLTEDSGIYLARFIETVAARPPQYIFSP